VRARWTAVSAGSAQRVYFANHSSHLDALVIWSSLPPRLRAQTRPVAAADYWGRTGLRRWLAGTVLNAVLVDREGRSGSRKGLRQIDDALEAGDSLILFPEGTRSSGAGIGPLKPGLYFIARHRPAVELMPVYLQNLSRILPKGEYLPVPLLGSATFGAPLARVPEEPRDAFLERARMALASLGADEPAPRRDQGAPTATR
jgi:1-acyl-sn-glycerol-3-phosphate acyltransferase